jgi:polar amino acid transport system substrate-binding protein
MTHSLKDSFAPTGPLRASINTGNPILARAEGTSASGVSIDMATRLAASLGVELELVVFDTAAKSVNAVESGAADIGFFAVDPKRGEQIAFTAPYVLIEGAYLVRQSSPIQSNDEVDVGGHRVVVGQGSAYDLFLSRNIKNAEIVRVQSSQAVVQTFLETGAEVAAGVRQQLVADSQNRSDLRLLDGRFMVIRQAMGVPKTRGAQAAQYLREFVEQAKAEGFVKEALARHHIRGAGVAPSADPSVDPLTVAE